MVQDKVYFSRDYSDIPRQLLEYSSDPNMLKAITDYAKAADFGIEDMQFEINSNEINVDSAFPSDIPEGIKAALQQFLQILEETSNNSEVRLRMNEVKAAALHSGLNRDGSSTRYSLELADESDGTRKFIALAPAIESALSNGGILLIDEIEKELHPMLVEYVVAKFQSKKNESERCAGCVHNSQYRIAEYGTASERSAVFCRQKKGRRSVRIIQYQRFFYQNNRKYPKRVSAW